MRAWVLEKPGPVGEVQLRWVDVPTPALGEHDLLIKVSVCGVCHTDLHIVEGDIELPKLPVIPGHQIVGRVEKTGTSVNRFKIGDRVGVPWLNWACGQCEYCLRGQENLCDYARFTGYHVDGGYADYQVTDERFAYAIPEVFSDEQAAPLLCAGVVGYRALKLAGAREAKRLGLYGFGASAHIAIQIARYWGVETYVFTRSPGHRKLAEELGAVWTGASGDDPGVLMDSSIIFAPAGQLVPEALKPLRKGGTLVLAGIHMSPIPELDYSLIWGERVIRSVANATRADAEEMLALAAQIPIRTELQTFPMDQANEALSKLKRSEIKGAAVLKSHG
jgi:propanol-preferring alcohol dehydrogenase